MKCLSLTCCAVKNLLRAIIRCALFSTGNGVMSWPDQGKNIVQWLSDGTDFLPHSFSLVGQKYSLWGPESFALFFHLLLKMVQGRRIICYPTQIRQITAQSLVNSIVAFYIFTSCSLVEASAFPIPPSPSLSRRHSCRQRSQARGLLHDPIAITLGLDRLYRRQYAVQYPEPPVY